MLEGVQINIAAVQGVIRQREIRELDKFQMDPFLR